MSVIARFVSRNVFNKPQFYRQIFIHHNQGNKEDFQPKFKKWNPFKVSIAGIATSIIGYGLFKDYLSQFVPSLPKVIAATATPSRRAQVSFISKTSSKDVKLFLLTV